MKVLAALTPFGFRFARRSREFEFSLLIAVGGSGWLGGRFGATF
jgi:hypothetical protein